jgi:hypothetical protein
VFGRRGLYLRPQGEAYADLLVAIFFSPLIFLAALSVCAFIFVMFTFVSETKPWRKWK